jgi:hypothetical protein
LVPIPTLPLESIRIATDAPRTEELVSKPAKMQAKKNLPKCRRKKTCQNAGEKKPRRSGAGSSYYNGHRHYGHRHYGC